MDQTVIVMSVFGAILILVIHIYCCTETFVMIVSYSFWIIRMSTNTQK